MGSRRRNLFVLLFVAGLVLASLVAVATQKAVLGLDLSGGTELVYQGRPTPQNPKVDGKDIDRSIEIIRKRTDKLGVSEPEISRIGRDSVRVALPNVSNADRAQEQVGTTAQLYFYDWEGNVIGRPGVEDPGNQGFIRPYEAVVFAAKQDNPCEKCTGASWYLFGADSKELIAGPTRSKSDLYLDKRKVARAGKTEAIEVPEGTIVVVGPRPPDDPATEVDESRTGARQYFVIRDRPEISGNDIRNPEQNFDQTNNQPIVTFDFTDEGRAAFATVTKRIADRGRNSPGSLGVTDSVRAGETSDSFAVILDGEVVSNPIINWYDNPTGIDGRGGAQIEGFTVQEAQDVANFLQIGALPVELKLISQTTVSATLGKQALDQGLRAGLAGLLLVLIFLVAYYRLLGVVAAVGLLVYALFFYALILVIPITLTLPGIAGLILTIGVAADSNIVIFERIKEEARTGRSIPQAIAAGYRKGISTIIDANVITLITAFILFVLATSGVKGFAFTLGVGTIVSLFTAVVFTQAFLGLFGAGRFIESPQLIGAREKRFKWRFDFTSASRWFFSFSGALLLAGALSFAVAGFNFGIDFESGTRITVGLDKPATEAEVKRTLEEGGIKGAAEATVTTIQSQELGSNAFRIQGAEIEPEAATASQTVLEKAYGIVPGGFDNTTVGPTFGQQVATSAAWAVLLSLLVICGYVAVRFEPKYSVPVIIALIHDILITAGIYSLSGREVTSATVAAFLTILGYSLYDCVIVFDRIRENVPRLPRATFSQIVNRSMSEVLTRSLITGLSAVFLVGMLLVFGGDTLKDFAFAMMIGIASGTYSSIFIAAPVLNAWKEREPAFRRRRERIIDQMGYVPAFPDENEIAMVSGPDSGGDDSESEPPSRTPRPSDRPGPDPVPPPSSRSPVPGVVGETPEPLPVQPPPSEAERPGAGAADGDKETSGDGLSDASEAALRRVRDRSGRKKGRGKRGKGGS